MAKLLDGNVLFVTGGASGIGRATALRAASEGAAVSIVDLDKQGAEDVASAILAKGGQAIALVADVSSEAAVVSALQQTIGTFGKLDCAFNNAGISPKINPIAEVDLADWQRVLMINLTAPLICMKYQIQEMLRGGGGTIVNTASVAALLGVPTQAAYAASKHGVLGLTRTASAEYGRFGIRVNAVCPGFIETPLTAGLGPELAELVASNPIGRIGQPADVAEVVVWLLSPGPSFITGQAVVIDGGRFSTTTI